MRKWLYPVLLFVIISVLIFIYYSSSRKNFSVTGKININGEDIAKKTATIYIHKKYAVLPLTEVFKGLGYSVEWMNNNTAYIVVDENRYILELNGEASLKKDSDDCNLIIPPPGSTTFYSQIIENELILDSDTIRSILFFMGKLIYINIDYDSAVVYITMEPIQ